MRKRKRLFDTLFDRPPERPTVEVPLPDPAREVEGKVGHDHAETAKAAARYMRYKVGSQKRQIVDALYERRATGLTAAEASMVIHRSRNQTAARLLELHEDGWVTFLLDAAGLPVERATDAHGNRGRVHVLTIGGLLLIDSDNQ